MGNVPSADRGGPPFSLRPERSIGRGYTHIAVPGKRIERLTRVGSAMDLTGGIVCAAAGLLCGAGLDTGWRGVA